MDGGVRIGRIGIPDISQAVVILVLGLLDFDDAWQMVLERVRLFNGPPPPRFKQRVYIGQGCGYALGITLTLIKDFTD